MTNVYFYEVSAYGYEESIEKQYYNKDHYTQDEFEDTVFKVMDKLMNQILKDDPDSLCYYNIFYAPDDLLLHKLFDEYMEVEGFQRIDKFVSASIDFELNNRCNNKFNNRLNNIFLDLEVDESCKYNDCSRIPEKCYESKEYLRKGCGVTLRENLREKQRLKL